MILKDPQTNDTRLSDEPIEGWVEITQEELEAIYESRRAVQPPIDPRIERLRELDRENELTQHRLREIVMLMTEAFKQVTGGALDLTAIPGVSQVFAVEAEAAAIRAELGQATAVEAT